jgi:hypothetical protein
MNFESENYKRKCQIIRQNRKTFVSISEERKRDKKKRPHTTKKWDYNLKVLLNVKTLKQNTKKSQEQTVEKQYVLSQNAEARRR